MYKTYYLKFASQEEWDTKAAEAGYRYEDPETGDIFYTVYPGAIDVVGTLYNDDAVYDDEGDIVTPATTKEGWHVNIIVKPKYEFDFELNQDVDYSLPEVLNTYIVDPQTPSRVFA
jgi:hypothetical protein